MVKQLKASAVVLALLGGAAGAQHVGAAFYFVLKLGATLQLQPAPTTECASDATGPSNATRTPGSVAGGFTRTHGFIIPLPLVEARNTIDTFISDTAFEARSAWKAGPVEEALHREFVDRTSPEYEHLAELRPLAQGERAVTLLCVTTRPAG